MIDKPNKSNLTVYTVKHDLFVSKTFIVKDYLNPTLYNLK